MDAWPISLQQTLNAAGFEVKFGNTLLRTEMDAGLAKVRSRYTDAIDQYGCQIFLDFDQYSDFSTFYKTTLNNGALPFTFTDPFTETETVYRFAESPVIRPLGGRMFQVSMVWEKLP